MVTVMQLFALYRSVCFSVRLFSDFIFLLSFGNEFGLFYAEPFLTHLAEDLIMLS